MTFGTRLKALREERGLLQQDIASVIGIGVATISDYEKDKKKPRPQNLAKLAHFFGVTTDYLLTGKTSTVDQLEEDFPEGVQVLRRATTELSKEDRARMIKLIKAFLDEE